MGLSDTLRDAMGGLLGHVEQEALPELMKTTLGTEGLQTIVGKLNDAGLATEVGSWLDKNRANLPISPEQIRDALGDAHVQQLARSLGIPVDAILAALAKYLPQAVSANPQAAAPTGG